MATKQRTTRPVIATVAACFSLGCSQLGVDPVEPAAIELSPFPVAAIVVGDSLRDVNGVASPAQAIVRNIRGDVISDAQVTYVYADFNRDSALVVDPVTGHIFATKTPSGAARIAARVGNALQVLRTIAVTIRPDSMDREGQPEIVALTTTLPDNSPAAATANTSVALGVVVRHVEPATEEEEEEVRPVGNWIVQYTLIMPANSTNDSTQAVFLVNPNGRASSVDTTDAQGVASRRVRVRAAQFPTGSLPDSVVVDAIARYRGTLLNGAPVRMVVPVIRGNE